MAASQHELSRLNWALSAYGAALSALVRSDKPTDLMSVVCQAIVEESVYVLAFIGIAETGPGKPVRIAAKAGAAMAYADGLDLSWSERSATGRGPTGRAIRLGEPAVVRDSLSDPIYALWRERGRLHGIRSSATVPFRKAGEVIGVLVVYASEPDAFGPKEMDLFARLGEQLAFAISLEEDRQRLKAAEDARRKAEKTVLRERDFSDAVIRSLPGVLYMYDEDGRFLRWNENFERVLGYGPEEIAQMRPADFFAPEERERAAIAIAQVFATGQWHIEADLFTKDGRTIPHYLTGVATEIDGRRCLVGIGIDFTERKAAEAARQASEARYRSLFDYAPDGILIADLQGGCLDANLSICRMLGYERDELIALSGADIVSEAELDHLAPALEEIRMRAAYHREWTFRRKDGSVFPAEVAATLTPDGSVMALVRDITERKEAEAGRRAAEDALRDMQAELARIGRVSMLGEFAATIAHEVNQPLAAIVMNADASLRWLAADPPNLERAREALNRITRDSQRAHDVIKRTRAMVRRGEPDYAEVDLNEAIEEMLLVTRREQQRARVTIEKDLRAGLPAVRGNRTELQQVVLNLVLNGIEAMRGIVGRERVLRVQTTLDESGKVLASVQDSGVGLDAATADRLFEHFFTTKIDGTGLGLAISRSIIEAHGGRLWASPGARHGALFQFTLPVVADWEE